MDESTKKQNGNTTSFFDKLSDKLVIHVFTYLNGKDLGRVREVSSRWKRLAEEPCLWQKLCIHKWHSLSTDKHIWPQIKTNIDSNDPASWREIYPYVHNTKAWSFQLWKSGRLVCNILAHHISGRSVAQNGLTATVVMDKRVELTYLDTMAPILVCSSIFHLEPKTELDDEGYQGFITYLHQRERAGIAGKEAYRYLFIPPCEYSRTSLQYHGNHVMMAVIPVETPCSIRLDRDKSGKRDNSQRQHS